MRILHYISNPTADNPIMAAAQAMMACTAKVAETRLISAKDVPRLRPLLADYQPDVVHLHGAWDFTAAKAEWLARHHGVVTIVSPHRLLSQEIINIDFWKHRLPRLLAYQIWQIRGCTAVAAVSEREKEGIMALGLKKRIEVVPMYGGLREASSNTMRDALMATYRKALDSTYDRRMTQAERDFVLTTVQAAVAADSTPAIPAAGGLSYRNIFFHAYDEGVTELMVQGAQRLGLTMPPTLNVEAIPRYKNRKSPASPLRLQAQAPSVSPERGSVWGGESTPPLGGDGGGLEGACFAVEMIASAARIGLDRLALQHYAELYRLLRHTDFNEDLAAAELRRRHLRRHTIRLQQRLHRLFQLPPGFNVF